MAGLYAPAVPPKFNALNAKKGALMATIKATFFTFEKRDNSTKKPTDGGTELSVTFKEDTDILNPQLEVRYTGAFNFNYVHIDFTGRYYRITNAVSIAHDTYLLNCAHDVLANWIDEAKGQSVFTQYSSSNYDIWLDDERVTVGHNITRAQGGLLYPANIMPIEQGSGTPTVGEFLGVISETGLLNGIDILFGAVGSLSYIIQQFADLSVIETFKSGSPWDAICEAYYSIINPSACHSVVGGHVSKVWGKDITGSAITNPSCVVYSSPISLPVPSNIDFRFSDKYVKYYLNIPFSGVITIPTSLVLKSYQETGGAPVALVTYSADAISGQFACEVKVAGVSLGMFGANLKVNLQLGGRQTKESVMLKQGSIGAVGAAGAALGAGGGIKAAALGIILGGAAGVAKAAVDIPPLESFGHYGGNNALPALAGAVGRFSAVKIESDSNIDPATLAAVAGRPSGKITTIGNGYIKTENASVSLSALSEEITAFNNLLNGGIYVE